MRKILLAKELRDVPSEYSYINLYSNIKRKSKLAWFPWENKKHWPLLPAYPLKYLPMAGM